MEDIIYLLFINIPIAIIIVVVIIVGVLIIRVVNTTNKIMYN